jgi:hypothetical protein
MLGGIGASYGASGGGAVRTASAEQPDKPRKTRKKAVLF